MEWLTIVLFGFACVWMFAATVNERIRSKIVWEDGPRLSRFAALAWGFFFLAWLITFLASALSWNAIEEKAGWIVGTGAFLIVAAMVHTWLEHRRKRPNQALEPNRL